MVENQGVVKELANREGQQEIAKAVLNFGSMRNVIRSESAAVVSERMSNRSYYYACEAERFADIASRLSEQAAERAADRVIELISEGASDIYGFATVEQLNQKLSLSGGRMTGPIVLPSGIEIF